MDSGARRSWKVVAGLAILVVFYWLALFVATHVPMQTTPGGNPYSLDKLEHLTAFAAPCSYPATGGDGFADTCIPGTRHFGNEGRNSLRGPNFRQSALSLIC